MVADVSSLLSCSSILFRWRGRCITRIKLSCNSTHRNLVIENNQDTVIVSMLKSYIFPARSFKNSCNVFASSSVICSGSLGYRPLMTSRRCRHSPSMKVVMSPSFLSWSISIPDTDGNLGVMWSSKRLEKKIRRPFEDPATKFNDSTNSEGSLHSSRASMMMV